MPGNHKVSSYVFDDDLGKARFEANPGDCKNADSFNLRSTSASPALTSNGANLSYGRPKMTSQSADAETSVGIKLREMYTNRAFVCEDDYRRHQRALQ